MSKKIKWKNNTMKGNADKASVKFLGEEEIKKARDFHQSFPQFTKTPLVNLDNLAKHLGVAGVYVKDESYRFGLNAFKVLGGSFSMGKYLAKKLGKDISELSYAKLNLKMQEKSLEI